MFILLLFLDSCNRVWRVSEENSPSVEASVRETYRTDMHARIFYAQRNMYLCGFTLFLSLYSPDPKNQKRKKLTFAEFWTVRIVLLLKFSRMRNKSRNSRDRVMLKSN